MKTVSVRYLFQLFLIACLSSPQAFAQREAMDSLVESLREAVASADFSRALDAANQLVSIAQSTYGAHHLTTADAINSQAQVLERMGRLEEALQANRQALSITQDILGRNHQRTARSLNNVGSVLFRLGRYQEAYGHLTAALDIRIEALGDDHADTASTRVNLAEIYKLTGNIQQAVDALERAHRTFVNNVPSGDPRIIVTVNNLANIYGALGEMGKAASLLEGALADAEASLSQSDPRIATLLNNLGFLYQRTDQLTKAIPLYERALSILDSVYRDGHPDIASIANNIAGIYRSLGRYEEAWRNYDRALNVFQRALGPTHPQLVVFLNNAGSMLEELGRYSEAITLHERSLSIQEQQQQLDTTDSALFFSNLGLLHRAIGNNQKAEAFFARALEIYQDQLGRRHIRTAEVLNNLGSVYEDIGQFDRAEKVYLDALDIYRNSENASQLTLATILNNVGGLYAKSGKLNAARTSLREALALRAELETGEDPLSASTLNNLANLELQEGNVQEAIQSYVEAVRILQLTVGDAHPRTSEALANLAGAYEIHGEFELALETLERAEKGRQHTIESVFAFGTEDEKSKMLWQEAPSYYATLSLVRRQFRTSQPILRRALDLVWRQKAAVLKSEVTARLGTGDSEDAEALDVIRHYERQYAELLSLPVDDYRRRGGSQRADQLAERIEGLRERLGRDMQGEVRFELASGFSVDAVAQALDNGGLLIEIVKVQEQGVRVGEVARYIVFTLDSKGRVTLTDLGPSEAIDNAIVKFQQVIASGIEAGGFSTEGDSKDSLRALYETLIAGWQEELSGKEQIYVSADGLLVFLPFGALVSSEGKYLAEDFSFVRISSGPDVARPRGHNSADVGLVIFADPDFDAPAANVASSTQSSSAPNKIRAFGRLEGTREEASLIAAGFEERRVYLGPRATEEQVRNAPPSRVLHFATHGFFGGTQGADGRIARRQAAAPSRGVGGVAEIRQGSNERPVASATWMTQSGLVMAGANIDFVDGGDDGLLTALEIQRLHLSETEVVVLSACDTGLGHVESGEGVYGLPRAFLMAGAKSVVMTLWSIKDRFTTQFMRDFYGFLNEGMTPEESLHRTQVKAIEDLREETRSLNREPSAPVLYWAPYVIHTIALR